MAERVLLATRSPGKIRELRPLLADAGFLVVDLDAAGLPEDADEERLESAATFEENALRKARHFYARSGLPTIADDSGLEVRALGGKPGVHSKRWSNRPDLSGQSLDDANNALLVSRLSGVRDRRAQYVCAAAWVDDARAVVERGVVTGVITQSPRGRGGFGYDPYFVPDDLDGHRTFAEVTREEKARVSHRARAVRALLNALRSH